MYNLPIIAAALLGMTQAVSAACTNPSPRKAWTALTDAEKTSYIDSELCLMDPVRSPSIAKLYGSKTVWQDLQIAHVAQVQIIHAVGAFLPWHRWFMTVHEKFLRDNCGYTGPMPYWDEQKDVAAGALTEASIWGTDPTTSFGTGATDDNGCVIDGPFANVTFDINAQLENVGVQCLQYDLKEVQFALLTQALVDVCNTFGSYDEFNACLGNTPHTSGHFAIGGTMDDVALSPADPLFFMHHTNLDRLWWVWQSGNESRINDMGGDNLAKGSFLAQPEILPAELFAPYFEDGGDQTTLDHVMWMAGIVPNITIREVVDVKSDAICIEYV